MRKATQLATIGTLAVGSLIMNGPVSADADRVRAEGAIVRHDPTLMPAGSWARVQAVATPSGSTIVTLQVRGLVANRNYGAHAHTSACGIAGASGGGASGPHYQNIVAPVTTPPSPPSPTYANPYNEIWLDLTTDADGNGSAQAKVDWHFRVDGANSVVLHATHTHDGSGTAGAGTAGARLGCLSVNF